mgnify:CR=1 FL=1
MAKFKNVFKILVRAAMIIGYLGLIVVLVWQALTPGRQSSNISSSVGDKLNEVVTEIKKPVVEIVNVESISISSVTVDGKKYSENITLSISQSGTVNCKVAPENATNQSLKYRSSDEQILTVYATGKIVGKGEGTASVIVSAAENEEITAEITVNVVKVLATKLQIDNIPKELHVGESHKLGTLFTPKNASDRSVKWTSSNTSVISVNSSGSLSAKKEGTATITVTSATNPSLTASVTITVLPKIEKPILPVSSIKISAKSTVGYIGSTLTLSAKLSPSGSTGKVEWYSADEEIATITQSGVVTCLLAGKVTITAKCGENITDSITITVKEVISKTITLEAWNLTATDNGYLLKQGKAAKIFATLDETATVHNVSFASSDESVAKIGPDGVIEALAGGTVTITVSTSYDDETTEVFFQLVIDPLSLKDTIENFYYVVRKSVGHFGAFLVLGFLGSHTYYIIFKKNLKGKLGAFVVNLVAGFAVAGITEILQLPYFTQGRYCSFNDVLLDFNGYCTSSIPIFTIMILAHFILPLIKKKKNR